MKTNTTPQWGTIAEAAEHLGVSIRTVQRWIRAGKIPAHRFTPHTARVRLDLLDDFGRPGSKQ